ncbi:MAG: hypothetical protein EOM91_23840 [Sphingobacteriia bacterium]|jgi:hypothetical protein|nr:hypothetical protein [Sphingobacteriia bacterium]
MSADPSVLDVIWEGPFSWPGFADESQLPGLPDRHGVYLQTFDYADGYLIYAAGLTRRVVIRRFREHTRHYMNGDYNVLDLAAARRGLRREIWNGWGYARTHREEFEARKREIVDAVKVQLGGFRIFLAEVEPVPRLMERIEAAVMRHLESQDPPISSISDRGMMLAARWPDEMPLTMRIRANALLHGFPDQLEI